jgi:hypothetical protein
LLREMDEFLTNASEPPTLDAVSGCSHE